MGAVVAGFITVFILSVVTDIILEVSRIFPSQDHPELYTTGMLVFALLYRSLYTCIGGYVTARLSATNPMRQVYILAIIGFLAGTAGAIVYWNKVYGNEWYPILLVLTGSLFVWLGGRLYKAKTKI